LELVMVVLGLFLLVVAGLVTGAMVLQNTDASSASVFGQAVNGTVGGLFLAGVIAGAVAILGVMMIVAGLARRRARRVGLKRQARAAHSEKETLAEENARLQRELEESRTGAAAYPTESGHTPDGTYPAEGTGGRHAGSADSHKGLFRR
jgi:hypothetical protein